VEEAGENGAEAGIFDGEEGVDDFVGEGGEGGVRDAERVFAGSEAAKDGETGAPDVDFGTLSIFNTSVTLSRR
jgi:hypothetical protein